MTRKTFTLFDPQLVKPAIVDSFKKLDPRVQWRNPVMFVVYIGSIITTALFVQALGGAGDAPAGFILAISLWLWFTVLFANFAEALAEGRSKAQAASLRTLKKQTWAKKIEPPRGDASDVSYQHAKWHPIESSDLRKGDIVMVLAKDLIPADGEVIEGVASVDESAITGESAPVIRESGGDFSAVTGGTRVLSDWIVVRISVNPGETFVDRMIAMVESAKRQKTPNEIALTILLVALTIVFLVVTVTLLPFSIFSVGANGSGTPVTAEKSPPDSRITGADSPVMALSSTEATPSTTSPSAGIVSPADTSTSSPNFSSVAETSCGRRSSSFAILWATTAVRLLRSDAAWALPCPSAIASAKLANSTVNQSQSETPKINAADSLPPTTSA
jgi:membrane protein implicated in regulation of membrane protease activity